MSESHINPAAVLIVPSDSSRSNALHFPILNEGWDSAKDVTIAFHLTSIADNAKLDYSSPFPYSISIGDIDDANNVDLTESFKQAGVNMDGLSSLQVVARSYGGGHDEVTVVDASGHETKMSEKDYSARRSSFLGPFKKGGAVVSGEISYTSRSSQGGSRRRAVKFSTIVWIFDENLAGAAMPPSFQYGTRLEVEGTNYTRRVNISHELKPGTTDRFGIKIGVDKSSSHKIHLQLVSNGSQVTDAGRIDLDIFVPRSCFAISRKTPTNSR